MLLCLAACWGGVVLGQTPAAADILWPANGLILAFLLGLPRRSWFSYLFGSVVANMLVHALYPFSFWQTLLYSLANTVEILVAAIGLAPRPGWRIDLTNVRTLIRFFVYGVVLAPLVSTLFVALLWILYGHPAGLLGLLNWFVGDATGIIIMTPLMLALERHEIAALFDRARRWETVVILGGLLMLSVCIFAQSKAPVVFLLFPALLLIIFRLGNAGSAIGIFLMVASAAIFTVQLRGPFAPAITGSLIHSILLLQSFLFVSLLTIYMVSAVLAGRDRHQQQLTVAYQEADANAATDHVTGLANRRAFDQKLAQEWRRAVRDRAVLSLIMIDVDQFKLYNDYYGHLAGDACLRTIGEILGSAPLRETDLAARYGGEEFAILLPRAGSEGAAMLAQRICQTVADRHIPHLPYHPGIVTLSMGVATIRPIDEWSESMLIEKADQALYCAKKEGRNQVKLWENMPQPSTAF
ncbi:MAG TPA: diguanylate cyclase [Acidobacteriaceae bacterium]|jgi:diguanylate cyclase (GGDEF)-like protein|nr:diguanylate cyclase [Acidobacteriaceae bacterium]